MMTFKGETRIDYVLISPQLVQFVKDFKVQPETVSDHALVSLRLHFPGEQLKTQTWKTCRDPEVLFRQCRSGSCLESEVDHQIDVLVTQGQIETAYRRFVKNYEKGLHEPMNRLARLSPWRVFVVEVDPSSSENHYIALWLDAPGMEIIKARLMMRPSNFGSISNNCVVSRQWCYNYGLL